MNFELGTPENLIQLILFIILGWAILAGSTLVVCFIVDWYFEGSSILAL